MPSHSIRSHIAYSLQAHFAGVSWLCGSSRGKIMRRLTCSTEWHPRSWSAQLWALWRKGYVFMLMCLIAFEQILWLYLLTFYYIQAVVFSVKCTLKSAFLLDTKTIQPCTGCRLWIGARDDPFGSILRQSGWNRRQPRPDRDSASH